MKSCARCHTEKNEAEFSPNRKMASGRGSWCKRCNADAERDRRIRNPEKYRHYRESNKGAIAESHKKHQYGLRRRAILLLGGVCACCGESEYGFLTIDHIHNDGSAERRRLRCASGVYKHILQHASPRERYRVLCFNCNCGRRHGPCPHEAKQTMGSMIPTVLSNRN